MNIEQDLKRYICVCANALFWIGLFEILLFFNVPGYELWSTNMPIHVLTCCCWQSILDRVSTAEPFFLRIRRRGTVQNDRQSAWNSSIWKQMESATTKNQ